jgi:hypothetical protein
LLIQIDTKYLYIQSVIEFGMKFVNFGLNRGFEYKWQVYELDGESRNSPMPSTQIWCFILINKILINNFFESHGIH